MTSIIGFYREHYISCKEMPTQRFSGIYCRCGASLTREEILAMEEPEKSKELAFSFQETEEAKLKAEEEARLRPEEE